MLEGPRFHIIFGQALVEQLRAEKAAAVSPGRSPGTWDSSTLCRWQESVARRGVLGAELVQTAYGVSVRYDSGLQNFGLLASSRAGQVDGSREAAVAFAEKWVAADPQRRYAWERV